MSLPQGMLVSPEINTVQPDAFEKASDITCDPATHMERSVSPNLVHSIKIFLKVHSPLSLTFLPQGEGDGPQEKRMKNL